MKDLITEQTLKAFDKKDRLERYTKEMERKLLHLCPVQKELKKIFNPSI